MAWGCRVQGVAGNLGQLRSTSSYAHSTARRRSTSASDHVPMVVKGPLLLTPGERNEHPSTSTHETLIPPHQFPETSTVLRNCAKDPGPTSAGENNKYRYLNVSAITKLCISSIFFVGRTVTSCKEQGAKQCQSRAKLRKPPYTLKLYIGSAGALGRLLDSWLSSMFDCS